jgi:hypothetical protein
MKVTNIRSILFIVLVVMMGCSEDKNDVKEVDQQNTQELLTAHPWKFSKQEVNGQSSDYITSNSMPYVAIFNDNGTFAMANFYFYEDNLPWTYNEEKLYVEDQQLNIDEISETKLTISYSDDEDGDVTLFFKAEEPADAFSGDLIYGKHFKVAEAEFNSEAQTMENNLSLFRFRALIEDGTATATSEKAVNLPYTIVSKTFVFAEGMDEGYDMEVDANGDLHLVTQHYSSSAPKSANVTGNTETGTVYTMTFRFTECNPWDFLTGPDWKLTEVEKDGQVITENLPIELGTIWFINPLTNKIEEQYPSSDGVEDYSPWEYIGTPTADDIQLKITFKDDDNNDFDLTFTVIQISLTQLVFETNYESASYRLTFSVDPAQEL